MFSALLVSLSPGRTDLSALSWLYRVFEVWSLELSKRGGLMEVGPLEVCPWRECWYSREKMKHRGWGLPGLKPEAFLTQSLPVGSSTASLMQGPWQRFQDPSPLNHEYNQFLLNWEIMLHSMITSFLSFCFIFFSFILTFIFKVECRTSFTLRTCSTVLLIKS